MQPFHVRSFRSVRSTKSSRRRHEDGEDAYVGQSVKAPLANSLEPPAKENPSKGLAALANAGVPRLPRATAANAWNSRTNLELTPSNSRQNLISAGRNSVSDCVLTVQSATTSCRGHDPEQAHARLLPNTELGAQDGGTDRTPQAAALLKSLTLCVTFPRLQQLIDNSYDVDDARDAQTGARANPYAQTRPRVNPYAQNGPRVNPYAQSHGQSNPNYLNNY